MTIQSRQEVLLAGGRNTGRTTRMILKIIYTAMYNPGQPIVIMDHENTVRNIKLNVVPRVKETIARLQLKGFEIKRDNSRYLLVFTNPLTEQNN